MAQDRPSDDQPATARDTGPQADTGPSVDRRDFMKAITGESITTIGKLAGLSGTVAGAVMAGARAASDGFAALGAAPESPVPSLPPRPVPAAPAPAPAAALKLSDADRATVAALSIGLLATNQPGAAPAMGIVRFSWDGTAFRIPGRSATARTANLQRDPFAALTLVDPATGDALLLAGRARIRYGAEGRDGVAETLRALGSEPEDGWDRADTRGDPVLIVLEPQRCFRRRAADERP
jgi:hypothetical protein